MSTTRAIIFDMDDTLYAERDYVFSGYRAVAAAYAARIPAPFDLYERMRRLYDTPQRARVFNALLAEAGIAEDDTESLVGGMITVYRQHTPAITLWPEASALIQRLRSRYRLGVISDGYLLAQRCKAAALGLAGLVDEIILTDAWGREYWKPHPLAFEEMARRLVVLHEACVYVSDNLAKDFIAPNALAWTTVLIDRPDRVHASAVAPPGGAAQHTVGSLAELPELLRLDVGA